MSKMYMTKICSFKSFTTAIKMAYWKENTRVAHSEPTQTSKMRLFGRGVNYFCEFLHLRYLSRFSMCHCGLEVLQKILEWTLKSSLFSKIKNKHQKLYLRWTPQQLLTQFNTVMFERKIYPKWLLRALIVTA